MFTEYVCGFATCCCDWPFSSGNMAQLKPFGLCRIIAWAVKLPATYSVFPPTAIAFTSPPSW